MKLLALFCIMLLLNVQNAYAVVKIDITKGEFEPIPVAVADFAGSVQDQNGYDIGVEIGKIIRDDLDNCGLFRSLNKLSFIEQPTMNANINYNNWRLLSANLVVGGNVEATPSGIKVQFKMWDPYDESMIGGTVFRAPASSMRRIAHKIADQIYKRITGEGGMFDTRVLFISESGPQKKRVKRLAIIDQDGANYRALSDERVMALHPWFDPKRQRAAYVSYKDRFPRVYLLDIATGQQKIISKELHGMSFAPTISPDGVYAALSVAKNGTTRLYEINMATSAAKMLTNEIGVISTSPSYSPDGSMIVFNSDRGGGRHIYIMNKDGSGIRRISRDQRAAYSSPVWSPKGDKIAFIKMQGGVFHLGTMKTDGLGDEKIIVSDWLVEKPSWAPNGMALMYSKQKLGGPKQIYSVDILGRKERIVSTPLEGTDPSWSPLLD